MASNSNQATSAIVIFIGLAVLACGLVALGGGFDGGAKADAAAGAAAGTGAGVRGGGPNADVDVVVRLPGPRDVDHPDHARINRIAVIVDAVADAADDAAAVPAQNPGQRAFADIATLARRSAAEHLVATKAPRCTATAWIPHCRCESFAKF